MANRGILYFTTQKHIQRDKSGNLALLDLHGDHAVVSHSRELTYSSDVQLLAQNYSVGQIYLYL